MHIYIYIYTYIYIHMLFCVYLIYVHAPFRVHLSRMPRYKAIFAQKIKVVQACTAPTPRRFPVEEKGGGLGGKGESKKGKAGVFSQASIPEHPPSRPNGKIGKLEDSKFWDIRQKSRRKIKIIQRWSFKSFWNILKVWKTNITNVQKFRFKVWTALSV